MIISKDSIKHMTLDELREAQLRLLHRRITARSLRYWKSLADLSELVDKEKERRLAK